MNIDKPSHSASSSKTEVTSKYFTKGNDMDDSLSEFQEKKKNIAGPKKALPNKSRKKPIKRAKGQKDIKSLFNKKKNELVKYSNEFDHVCKQSGLDVDSEQLQLAIALSVSLQETQSTSNEVNDEEKSLTSQARVLKIRRTLQEYGFKVPDAKILVDSNKRVKKSRKISKLLTLSDLEKQQIISERYAEILSSNLDSIGDTTASSISKETLFYKTTSALYEEIQDNDVFVVSKLFETIKIPIDRHKKWSEIPGRPPSPVFEGPFISFNDIECTQDELDSLLSCSLKTTQELLSQKLRNNSESINVEVGLDNSTNMSYNTEKDCADIDTQNLIIAPKYLDKELPTTSNTFLTIAERARSASPDLFDDEDCLAMDTSHNSRTDRTSNENKFYSVLSHDVMDITECVNIGSNITEVETNLTVGNTEDFKEIINAVQENNLTKIPHEEIDLTQNDYVNDDTIEYCLDEKSISYKIPNSDVICVIDDHVPEKKHKMSTNDGVVDKYFEHNSSLASGENYEGTRESIDLTQSSHSSEELPPIVLNGNAKDPMDETVLINDNCYEIERHNESEVNKSHEVDLRLDNGLKVPDSEEITLVDTDDTMIVSYEKNEPQTSFSNNIDLTQCTSEEINVVNNVYKTGNKVSYEENLELRHLSDNIDLINLEVINDVCDLDVTRNNASYEENQGQNSLHTSINLTSPNSKEVNVSFDDVETSSNKTKEKIIQRNVSDSIDLTQPNLEEINVICDVDEIDHISCEENQAREGVSDNIDLTQSTNSSVDHSEECKSYIGLQNSPKCQKDLDKIEDVCVDYDEMFDNVITSCSNTNKSNEPNKTKHSNQNDASTSSNSGTFEISDKEINYSINRCRQENFAFGGISVLEEFPNGENSEICNFSKNGSLLPVVEIKNTDTSGHHYDSEIESTAREITPVKAPNYDMMKTPINKEYIIKTDEITPMPHYEAMSTPEMNKELDKYGIKPFKRKRAIKLLTYIYNQTHPIVDSCIEDEPSPSKKRKTNLEARKPKSPMKSSRKNCQKSPLKVDKENVYIVTDNAPVIKDIECCPEDWVFQTREKAKISSCRVPLHIAFHNYVHSRRSLREAILCYEPINIDTVHKDLVAIGYRYSPKDLLKFMDKKCITVKTADNDKRNRR